MPFKKKKTSLLYQKGWNIDRKGMVAAAVGKQDRLTDDEGDAVRFMTVDARGGTACCLGFHNHLFQRSVASFLKS